MSEIAQVVYERHPTASQDCEPGEYGRVGFSIGSRVFWVASFYIPGTPLSEYGEAVSFCSTVAARWNAALTPTQEPTR